jgi:hypothetical protein
MLPFLSAPGSGALADHPVICSRMPMNPNSIMKRDIPFPFHQQIIPEN